MRKRSENRSGRIGGVCAGAALVGLLTAQLASAVVIAGPDGAANTTPPQPDPGFTHVGRIGGLTGVYVRNGWVLTANHVGEGPIELGGLLYSPVPGSGVQIENPSPPHPDLFAFKLESLPPLPDLELISSPLALGEPLILIGHGRDRGAATVWTSPEGTDYSGWLLENQNTTRWGTNFAEGIDLTILDTASFASAFDELRGPARNDPEAQVVAGDSGGAVFIWNGAQAELAGILFARSSITMEHDTQPLTVALFGNASVAADLFAYRAEIEAIIDRPDCDNGLDDDGDGLIDYPEDTGCMSLADGDEVPEPSLPMGLMAGGLALLGMRKPRPTLASRFSLDLSLDRCAARGSRSRSQTDR